MKNLVFLLIGFIVGAVLALSLFFRFSNQKYYSYDCKLWGIDKNGKEIPLYRQVIYCRNAIYLKVQTKFEEEEK